MRDVMEFATYLIKKGADSSPNTFDGNVKLQKLLALADMAHLSEYKKLLFADDVLAYENGFVVEKVRLRYKNDYAGLKKESESFTPAFDADENETIDDVFAVYGSLTAIQLSDLSHRFKAWQHAYESSTKEGEKFHYKERSVVKFEEYPEDVDLVGRAIRAYRKTKKENLNYIIVNKIIFYYTNLELTEEVMSTIREFAAICGDDDPAYTIYYEDGRVVIY